MMLFYTTLSIFLSFSLVIISIPSIVKISHKKHLFDEINERKIHKHKIPALGGVAIFIGFIVSTIISTYEYSLNELRFIIASIILLFFIGLKDDLITVSNRKKFVIQVFAALLIIFLGNIRIIQFHGFLGFYEVNYLISASATLFVIILTINAYNLIDGIDGLASGLGSIGAAAFGICFFISGEFQYALLSFALLGSLIGFFIYNVYGTKNKIFMGDTGSLVIGISMSAILIRFNEMDSSTLLPTVIQESPALSFAIVIVPLVDTLRVFAIRMLNGKSPFAPDTNHVHHRLLIIFGDHRKVTFTIMFVNVLFIGIAVALKYLMIDINLQFAILIVLALMVSYVPHFVIGKRRSNPNQMVYEI